ncbi:UvrD-helicase domain-containing protein [Streptomyces sp. NPDC001571]
MTTGPGFSRRARQQRTQERRVDKSWEVAHAAAADRWGPADHGETQVAGHFLALTRLHWYLLVDRQWPRTGGWPRAEAADMLLIGPGGIFVVDVSGRSGPADLADGTTALRAMNRAVAKSAAELGLTPVAVRPVVVFTRISADEPSGQVRLLDTRNVLSALIAERQRLNPAQARAIAEHLARTFPQYELVRIDEDRTTAPAGQEAEGLFTTDSIKDEVLQAAQRGPIENWMTFLAPDQLSLVRRNWNGPARISGPAGTGKTVVALHRAAHLAQRTDRRILYVTFANNLPRVQQTFLHTMAPYVSDRVDFRSLHGFALEFLRQRDVEVRLDRAKAETSFSRAWLRVGRDGRLNELVPDSRYWDQEIQYVIKGRGITDFDAYAGLTRRGRGRGTVPQLKDREAVWELFETYESFRTQARVHDFQDVLTMALAELRDGAGETAPYASVIVDEAQDLPQVAVQMLHALVGDAPNGLLLVGDGQQAVYPGGFRLSDAGVEVRGDRGQVLRTNYRNAPQILATALEIVADVAFDDLDDTSGKGEREIELTCHDGVVTKADRGSVEEHDHELVRALKANDDHAGSAVLCFTRYAVSHYKRLLEGNGIPVCLLEDYDGNATEAVKLGTYTRAKGLDFKHVFLPRYTDALNGPTNSRTERAGGSQAAARERHDLVSTQLYVAMTRARDRLWLGTVPSSASGG